MLVSIYEKDGDYVHNGTIFDDSISVERESILQETETFIYFTITYRILKSAIKKQRDYHIQHIEEFWISVENVLNCLNAIYGFKEYIKESYGNKSPYYSENVIAIAEKYYSNFQWYTFACFYRNKMVHQAAFAKEYNPETGDTYIDLDEFYLLLEKELAHKKNPEQTKKMMCFIDELKNTSQINKNTNHHCLPTKYVLYQAFYEIRTMFDEICLTLYKTTIQKDIEWYLNLIKEINCEYKDTVVFSMDNMVKFFPNQELENTIMAICTGTAGDSLINDNIFKLLNDYGYRPCGFKWDANEVSHI